MKKSFRDDIKILFAALVSASLLFLLTKSFVKAERLESNSYVIQFGNVNTTSGEKSGAQYNVTDTVGQTAAGPFGAYDSTEYFVGAGFQYIYQIGGFSFSISDTDIELGELIIGQHSQASNILTVSTKGSGGYNIFAYELHPLRHTNGSDFIPDTTCDNGLCTEVIAKVWTNQLKPGFGFNISGDDIATDFIDSTYFRQFSNLATSEPMQPVMGSENVGQNRRATVTYKAGIEAIQAAGHYQTAIVYVAVPGY